MIRIEMGRSLLAAVLLALAMVSIATVALACGPEPGAASQQAAGDDPATDAAAQPADPESTSDEEGQEKPEQEGQSEESEQEESDAPPVRQPNADVQQTIERFKQLDPGIGKFFDNAAGYVVYPNIGKAGLGIGGAHGNGEVIAKGAGAIGKSEITQVTIGVQIGGQEYSEIIFFETDLDLERFKKGNLELAAQVSAVAITAGAADGANYKDGVAVFTRTKSGMMGEASVGGQKLSFEPY